MTTMLDPRRAAEAAMVEYFIAQKDESKAGAEKARAGKTIKAFLGDSTEPLLFEGLVAQQGKKQLEGEFDASTMPDDAVLAMFRSGGLVAAGKKALDAICKTNPRLADYRKRFQMPGGEQLALTVTPEKKP